MASQNELKIKLTLLADGLKQALGDAKQGIDNFKAAASSGGKSDFTDALKEKVKQAEEELKKAKEELDRLKTALNGKSGPLADSITQEIGKAEAKIRQTEAELDKLKAKLNSSSGNGLANSAKTGLDDVGKSAGGLRGTLDKTFGGIQGMIVGAFAIGSIVAFTNKLIDSVKQTQDLRIRLSGLTTSAQDYAASEAYLIDLSQRHHKSVQDLTGSYSAFLTLERSGIITRQQSMQLLEGFSDLASRTGASAMQMSQSIYGLSQALGTGVVNMQDFKQIVEPMPGLANEIAKSFGLTVGGLRELIATGTLTSDEFGRKVPEALKAYEGAAARSAGTLSASYADIGNSFTDLAKALEKPLSNGVLTVLSGISTAYSVLKENGGAVVNVLTGIAVVMAGKAVSGVVAYAGSVVNAIVVEKAHTAAIIENERRTVSAIATKVLAAEVKAAERKITADLAVAELLAANATLELAVANELASGSAAMLVDAQIAQTAAVAKATAATGSQAAADTFLGTQKARLTEATLALTVATNASGVAMTRLASAAKSAMAMVGGPVGVAVIALYGLYEILNTVTDAEGRAEQKANAYNEALKKINDSVQKLNAEGVQLETKDAQSQADELKAKIAKLEEFKFDNIRDFWGNADKRQVLLDDLKLTEDKLKALNQQDLELIKNFDATKLDSNGKLKSELDSTQAALRTLSDEAGNLNKKLHEQGKLSFYEQKQLDDDNLRINAFEAKESAIQKQIEVTSGNTQEVINKKKRAASKESVKGVLDDLKEVSKAEDEQAARRNELAQSSLASRKAEIELSTLGTLEKELLIAQATKASNDAQLLIIAHTGAEKLRITQETFAAEMEAKKSSAYITAALDEQSLQAKLGIYRDMEKSYSATVSRLVQEEVRLVNESKTLSDARKGIEQSYADFKLQLHQLELTDRQKTEEDLTRLRKLSSDQKKAFAAGDFKTAEELDLKILELGKSLALSDKKNAEDAKKHGKQYFDSVDEIVRITDTAQANILKTNSAAQGVTQQRLADTKAGAEDAKNQLQGVQTQIAAITKELESKKFMLIMNADSKAVDEAIARISKPTSSTHTITVQTVNNAEAHAAGGLIKGKGTGTSDEIPALLSNGEYVIPAAIVAKNGVAAFDAIRDGQPVQKFAEGGLVGDDKLKKKVDELKKQAYEQAVAVFNDPRNQIVWRMDGSTSGSSDVNSRELRFESHVGDYLRKNGLPMEWRDMYLKGMKASQVLRTQSASFEEKARAQIDIENQFIPATAQATTAPLTAQAPVMPASVSPPAVSMPTVTPPSFSPTAARSGVAAGKVSTIKFERPDGKATTGQSTDPDFAKFFENLNTISGVTKV